MKSYLTLVFIFSTLLNQAQTRSDSTYTGSFAATPLPEVLGSIESATGLQFYYHPDWLDSLSYSGRFNQTPISECLDKLFAGTELKYYQSESTVTLTHGVRIVTELGIKQYRGDVEVTTEPLEKGLVFSREYLGRQVIDNAENKVHEVGKVSQYIRGRDVTIAGYVRDVETGEPVEGASVFIENPLIGVSSDEDGFYSLTIPNGKQTININSLGMKNTTRKVVLFSNGTFNIDMEVDVIALKPVIINADRDINVLDAEMGVTRIDVEDSKNIPILLGERDIVKVVTTTSGVQTVGEGASGINVRGAKADQNLFMIDGAPVYNTSHFFGFFSVFNSESIGSFELYKSFIPAEYGGRLSSVFDIQTKTASKEKFSGAGGIGPVTSRLTLEIPLIKDRTSLMIGGRGTYSNLVLDRIRGSSLGNQEVSFYDGVMKVNHTIDDKNELNVMAYYSYDLFQLANDSLLSYTNFTYQNTALSAKWKHDFSEKLSGTTSAILSDYKFDIGYDALPTQAFNLRFQVQEKSLGYDARYYLSDKYLIKGGLNLKRYDITPGDKGPVGESSTVVADDIQDEQGMETAVYGSVQFDPNEQISLIGGLRYSHFTALGPGSGYTYAPGEPISEESVTGTTSYSNGEGIASYHGPEWRFSARYSINDQTSIKASLARTRQYIHILNNSASIAPTNSWRLSDVHVRPQIADQVSLGFYKNFNGAKVIETSIEVYYKKLQQLLDFKIGADLQFNKALERDILQGDGKAYGVELSIKKSRGWFSGWINYTYSRSFIKIDGSHQEEIVNEGAFFPTGYDKPHYFNLVTNYKFTKRYSLSANMVYSTGRPFTYPIGKWSYNGVENIQYSDRNAIRLPDYKRVDVGLNIEGNHKIRKLAHSFWSISIYNLLGEDNVYSVFFRTEEGELKGYEMSVFPDPIPTITYNFVF